MRNDSEYTDIKNVLDRVRTINENRIKNLNEFASSSAYNNSESSVPYTMQDQIMSDVTQSAKTQFGADFSQVEKPMLYYPNSGDVTLNGTIGDLNDAKFQFRYKDSSGNGCYIWISPLQLTDETLKKLSVINGFFKNWKNDLASAEDIKPMSMKNGQN